MSSANRCHGKIELPLDDKTRVAGAVRTRWSIPCDRDFGQVVTNDVLAAEVRSIGNPAVIDRNDMRTATARKFLHDAVQRVIVFGKTDNQRT